MSCHVLTCPAMSRMASGPMSFLAAAADLTCPSCFAWCALNVGVCACVSMTSTNDQAPDRRTSLSVPNTPKKGRRILASREGLESAQTLSTRARARASYKADFDKASASVSEAQHENQTSVL